MLHPIPLQTERTILMLRVMHHQLLKIDHAFHMTQRSQLQSKYKIMFTDSGDVHGINRWPLNADAAGAGAVYSDHDNAGADIKVFCSNMRN